MTEEFENPTALPGEGETPVETALESTETVEETVALPETEVSEPAAKAPEKDAGGIQKRFDEMTRAKYDALREAEYWKAKALGPAAPVVQPVQPPPPAPSPELVPPKEDDFESYDQYLIALGRHGAQVELFNLQRQAQEREVQQTHEERIRENQSWLERGAAKYPNLVEDTQRPGVKLNAATRDFALMSPYGHDIVNKLVKDSELMAKIFSMSPVQTVLELQKLEANFKAPQRAVTSAPASTSPVTGSEVPAKSLDDMEYDEYKAYRHRQLYGA